MKPDCSRKSATFRRHEIGGHPIHVGSDGGLRHISGAGAVERLWVWLHRLICAARTTAVLLGLLQQADLFLEQLIFELHVLEFEIQSLRFLLVQPGCDTKWL